MYEHLWTKWVVNPSRYVPGREVKHAFLLKSMLVIFSKVIIQNACKLCSLHLCPMAMVTLSCVHRSLQTEPSLSPLQGMFSVFASTLLLLFFFIKSNIFHQFQVWYAKWVYAWYLYTYARCALIPCSTSSASAKGYKPYTGPTKDPYITISLKEGQERIPA